MHANKMRIVSYTLLLDPDDHRGPSTELYGTLWVTRPTKRLIAGRGSYIYRSPRVKVVAGAGYFKKIRTSSLVRTTEFAMEVPRFGSGSERHRQSASSEIKHTNLYLYAYIEPVQGPTLTLGASGDLFDETGTFRDDVETPTCAPSGSLPSSRRRCWAKRISSTRSSVSSVGPRHPERPCAVPAFRTLKRTLVTDQTLEPTQVAGFNQFFDDLTATEAWVYGAAVDQKFSESGFGGVEYLERDMTSAVPYATGRFLIWTLTENADWKEKIGRLYLNGAPHPWVALRGGYVYEKFDRDDQFSAGIQEVKTQSIPLGISFFHPSGWISGYGHDLPQAGGRIPEQKRFQFSTRQR